MALNWGDVALNLTAGAIEKDEVYRKEQLEQRFKELQDNKELYRALATTRYSKDLDKYYKESEKYSNLKDVYNQIQSANSGKGMNKELAARKIIFSDPELFAEWNSYGTTKTGLAARLGMVSQVKSGFKDRTIDGKVVGYEFSHPGLELTSPKQEDYFQTPDYWSNLAKEIESKEMGPLKRQLVKLFRRKENHPAEVDLDTLDQKAGTDIKKLIDNKLYSSSNTDKGTSLITGGSGIIKSSFDVEGNNHEVFKIANADKKSWINKANTNQEMYSVLAQMGQDWIDTYLVKESWDKDVVRFKPGGESMAQQVRALWRDVVQFHYNETFHEGGIFPGSDTEVIDNFTFQEIMTTFRSEYDRRNLRIDSSNTGWASVWELLPWTEDKDFKISYVVDSSLLPYYEKSVVDGKETYVKPDVDVAGLQEHIKNKIAEYVDSGETTLTDVKGLETYIRAEVRNYYENVAPKKREEQKTEFVEIEITEDMVQSQMKEFDKTREEVIEDFQKNPIKGNRKFIFSEDFDLTGEATAQDIKEQEEELNKANKLPFRIDGPLTWQEWKDATAREVYDAYIDESPI